VTTVLLVEDDPAISEPLARAFGREGYEVLTHGTGKGALEEVSAADIIVLDLGLPDIDGLDVARQVRAQGLTIPILMLTARSEDSDLVVGLDAGADDYVTKPFGLEEVIARIRAILRRTHAIENQDDGVVRVADLVLDEDAHEVYRADVEVDLSPTEFKLLRYLMLNAGRVVSKAQILDHVWEYDWNGDAAIVESYISYLRRKVDQIQGADGQPVTPLIQTRRGVGYMLREPKAE